MLHCPPLRYVLCVVLFNTVSLHNKYKLYMVLYLQRLVFRYYNINLLHFALLSRVLTIRIPALVINHYHHGNVYTL